MFEIHERIYHLQGGNGSSACQSILSFPWEIIIITILCLIGIIWAVINFLLVEKISVQKGLVGDGVKNRGVISAQQESLLLDLGHKISDV
jgi:hypothetical protein